MHELSIVQNMVEICEAEARGRQVTSVTIVIGELSGVLPEAISFCFEACSKGTLLEDARLLIERVCGVARCDACGAEFPAKAYYEPCPACGSHEIALIAGEELQVRELEVA
ncbi:hydrogenase maturation nickel metallochaperone HypA [Geobacter sp. DSM 9736]|uniref:hydrogenase maturation nickel metallochaperone HypA n=1 Tax=Geobacter sp. DSM 9736 TaxID=1277350 RepID=UPI000B4FEB0E|nr:hydrogenase maturation nickel metallochaperone HypA [Geobacter sp. DSM 9736]SNB47093.1 hydrogenase nickel incorporation protein HypA/HybF [Geobacter sp. DSM 9736]